jgi:hypothetical protein
VRVRIDFKKLSENWRSGTFDTIQTTVSQTIKRSTDAEEEEEEECVSNQQPLVDERRRGEEDA